MLSARPTRQLHTAVSRSPRRVSRWSWKCTCYPSALSLHQECMPGTGSLDMKTSWQVEKSSKGTLHVQWPAPHGRLVSSGHLESLPGIRNMFLHLYHSLSLSPSISLSISPSSLTGFMEYIPHSDTRLVLPDYPQGNTVLFHMVFTWYFT